MAWYALYKWFIGFRKLPYINYVELYKRHLYEEWFNKLSNEEQAQEIERRNMEKRRKNLESKQLLMALNIMMEKCGRNI